MKRILSLVLVLLMLGSMLVACQTTTTPPDDSKPGSDTTQNKPNDSEVTTPSDSIDPADTDENGYLNDRLPDNIDYEGQKVYMLGWENVKNTAWPEEANTNSPIQDISYWHKKSIEDRLDIEFDMYYEKASWADQATFLTTARAEDGAYDLIHTYSLWPPILAQEGRLSNLHNTQFPDFEMPWWPETVNEYTQNGGLYFVASNSSILGIQNLEVIFALLSLIEEEGLGDPVKLVLRESWTLERFGEYVKKFAGLAEANPGELYGFAVDEPSRLDCLYYAAFNNTRNNASGIAEFAFMNEDTLEQITTYIADWQEVMTGIETHLYPYGNSDYSAFMNYQTVFFIACMGNIQNIEDTTAYAVLPIPKWNTDDSYRMIHANGLDFWSIPISSTDKELGGMIIEAVASSEYRTVAPFYFEQYLKRRYSSDAEGMQCFDLIRSSVIYDFGRVNFSAFSNAGSTTLEAWWRGAFFSGGKNLNNSFMTSYQSGSAVLQSTLEKIVDDYKNNNEN